MLPDLMREFESYGEYQIYNLEEGEDDGFGGYSEIYTPGETFEGVLILDDSLNAQIAEKQEVKGVYTLTFDKDTRLPFHTVIKSLITGQFFRVVSKDEQSTPINASFDFRQVKCEEADINA